MAAVEPTNSKTLKGNKIHVDVEEALEDLFVVSYAYGNKLYQGVLLDSTKMNMPHGIIPPLCTLRSTQANNVCNTENSENIEKKPEKFFSLRQRFTYFQQHSNHNIAPAGVDVVNSIVNKSKRVVSKDAKPARVMRLRPRQVLCSKCKSICNENSENVESIAKLNNGSSNQVISRSDFGVNTSPRLTLAERVNSNVNQPKCDIDVNLKKSSPIQNNISSSPRALDKNDVSGPKLVEKMILRKRKSDSSLDDDSRCKSTTLNEEWTKKSDNPDSLTDIQQTEDDKVFNNDLPAPKLMVSRNEKNDTFQSKVINKNESQDPGCNDEQQSGNIYPVIKISFANPKGEGTVLKIPRKALKVVPPSPVHSDDQSSVFRLSGRPNFSPNPHKDDASAKAAKKALKKAKKEAQRKSFNCYGNSTPNSSEQFFMRTPNNSPQHRNRSKHHHKHKLKHKRKHKEQWVKNKASNWNDSKKVDNENCIADQEDDVDRNHQSVDSSIKTSDSLKQKLSISLKRLNKGSYCAAPKEEDLKDNMLNENQIFNNGDIISSVKICESTSSNNSDNSTDCIIDEFPSDHLNKIKPLMMRITTHNVNKTYLNGGRVMYVGDIVWGKIQGFPWWPGKVLAITVSQRDNGTQITQQAHVTWFGSSTSSYMLCHHLLPFLEEFEHRHNKKKRGPYREAIRQANEEARRIEVERVNIGKVCNQSKVTNDGAPLVSKS